jgi:hypothetical protein
MKKWIFLAGAVLFLSLFAACGSGPSDMEENMQGGGTMESMQTGDSMKTSDEWIRSEPVDVAAVDVNQDGFVYQDQMDWNVIADEEGKCPKCNMVLVKVTVDKAIQNLKEHGFTVK